MALRMHLIQNARDYRIAPTMMSRLIGPVYNSSNAQNEAKVYVT